MNDFRYAVRQLLRAPGFAVVVILSLALGIGANAAVFTWIENLLLRPLPGVAEQERLVVVTTSRGTLMWDTVSLPDLRDAAAMKDVFVGLCGSQQTPASLTVGRDSEWLYGQIVTANFFDLLGVRPILGRGFTPQEDVKPGGHPTLVISEALWRRKFAADPGVIGRVVDLNRHAFTIVGVAPASFPGDITALRCDFWAPVMMHREVAYSGFDADQVLQRYARWHHTYARLQPGITLEQARAALDGLSHRLEQMYPDWNRDVRLHAWRLQDSTYGAQAVFRPMLRLLLVVSLGVLLIVSANIANLLLARTTSRQTEIAIRVAVGASRTRIVRQLLIESLVLALLGGALGVLASYWIVDLLIAFAPRSPLPIHLTTAVDTRILVATLVLTLASAALFGLLPALQASRPQLNEALKESGRANTSGVRGNRARSALVVIEVALALVLLIAAGLCVRGFRESRRIDPGLDPDGVLLIGLRVGMNGYTRDTAPRFYRALQQRIAAAPGVESVALANWFPLGFEDTGSNSVEITDAARPKGESLTFRVAIVSPGYFSTLRIPLLAGRDFTDRDDGSGTPVVIVNEAMARRFWPGQQVVGRTFKNNGRPVTIVGVVKTGKYRGLGDSPEPFFYLPYTQCAWQLDLGLCVRARHGDPTALTSVVRTELAALDPNVHIWQTLPMKDYIAAAVMPQKIASTLLTVLSAIALLLSAMGVYAVMAYAVSQRRHEIGIRMALGATPGDVRWHITKAGLVLAVIGIGVGFVLAAWATRLLAGFLYGVSPFDLATFVLVPVVLASVAALACYVPASRATRVDPVETLRQQ